MKKIHYTAVIKVERVEKEYGTAKFYNKQSRAEENVETTIGREVIPVADLSFTAADVDQLAERVGAHMTLITDGEAE
jgi:hypothetical protein